MPGCYGEILGAVAIRSLANRKPDSVEKIYCDFVIVVSVAVLQPSLDTQNGGNPAFADIEYDHPANGNHCSGGEDSAFIQRL
jgi:hypothetical protein